MTPELLQRVAKCAPEWMGAEYEAGDLNTDSPPLVRFLEGSTNPHPNCRPLRVAGCERELTGANEQDDAAACVLMREAIRRDGKSWVMYCEEQGPKYGMQIDSAFLGWRNENETLATVNAFLKVFEKEEA